MAEFKKKDNNKFWYSPLFLMVLFLLFIFLFYNIIGLSKKERDTLKNKEIVSAKIESLKERENSLSENINKLETEEGIEETIREKYQVVKEGEKMVIIVPNEDQNKVAIFKKNEKHNLWNWIKSLFNKK